MCPPNTGAPLATADCAFLPSPRQPGLCDPLHPPVGLGSPTPMTKDADALGRPLRPVRRSHRRASAVAFVFPRAPPLRWAQGAFTGRRERDALLPR